MSREGREEVAGEWRNGEGTARRESRPTRTASKVANGAYMRA